MSTSRIDFPIHQVVEFCQRWQVTEFSLFGSVLRDDFRPDSDVDVLVSFNPTAPWSLFDLVTMQDELQKIFGRPVDLVEREGLRNPFRKRSILSSREVIYASQRT